MKIPMFFARKGYWGEGGFVRVSFLRYLTLVENHVTRIKWVKCKLWTSHSAKNKMNAI
jgi:hypothetical protein